MRVIVFFKFLHVFLFNALFPALLAALFSFGLVLGFVLSFRLGMCSNRTFFIVSLFATRHQYLVLFTLPGLNFKHFIAVPCCSFSLVIIYTQ